MYLSIILNQIKYIILISLLFLYSYPSIADINRLTIERSNVESIEKYIPFNTNQKSYPVIPLEAKKIASLIIYIENSLRENIISLNKYSTLSHYQQVIYRLLSEDAALEESVISLLPINLSNIASLHIQSRKYFLNMQSSHELPKLLPAWKIIDPEPLLNLKSYYLKAEALTGIDWEILAAINLVETGMGRISGLSVANAQGPMQFLKSTWDQKGVGNGGDINDPNDSIQAAARYLVIRGGLKDIRKALWGYNNSFNYVNAVLNYVQLLKDDPIVLKALYYWQIHFRVNQGDLWLPVGYEQQSPIPINRYLKKFPISAPPNYSLNK